MKKEELNYPEKPLTQDELTVITNEKLNLKPSTVKSFKSIYHEVLVKMDAIKSQPGVIHYKHEKWKTVRDNVKLFQHWADEWNKNVVNSDHTEVNKYYSVYVLKADDTNERIAEIFDWTRVIEGRA